MAATGPEPRILDALLTYLTGRTFTPAVPVALPDIPFTPQAGKPYLAAGFLPNTTSLDGLAFDSDRTHAGLLVVTVVWPTGQGLVKPLQLTAQVAEAFKAGTRLWQNDLTVCIDEPPQVGGPIDDAPWQRFPVTVRWRVGLPGA